MENYFDENEFFTDEDSDYNKEDHEAEEKLNDEMHEAEIKEYKNKFLMRLLHIFHRN